MVDNLDLIGFAAAVRAIRWQAANPFRRPGTPKKERRGKDRTLGPALSSTETVTARMMFRANRKGFYHKPPFEIEYLAPREGAGEPVGGVGWYYRLPDGTTHGPFPSYSACYANVTGQWPKH